MCFASACYVHGNFLLNWTCFLLSLKYSNFFECFVSSFSGHWSIHCCCCFCSCRQLARPKTKCFRMKFPFCNLLALRENGKSVARVQLPSEEQFAHRIFATVPFEIGKPEAVTEIAEHQLMDAKRQLSIEFRVAVVVAATYCFSYILRRCLCLCDSAIWPSVLC